MLAKAKERGANPFENAPQPNDTRKSSTVDPLLGWFSLADGVIKPGRKRRQKRQWQRGQK